MKKKLYRNTENEMISGVCAGIADYLKIDVTLVRLIWAIVSVCSTAVPGVIIYIICSIVIPEKPDDYDSNVYYTQDNTYDQK